jgi:hypothetical protein
VSPDLLQNYSPFFLIQCHNLPILYIQDYTVLTTHSSHLSFGLPTLLVPSALVLNIFLMIIFSQRA